MQQVKCGLDRIYAKEYSELFSGKRLGLLTAPSAVTLDFVDSITVLNELYNLTALFSPEHGVRGEKQAGLPVSTYTDERTGVPVHSIYGKETHKMTAEQTEFFDVLVYDIQDVGSRFYTYLANLLESMEICAKMKKPLVVLDRPNPIGDKVEGNIADEEYHSLVCAHTMPQRYGLTVGEFALMVNGERNIGCEIHVIPMENYKRDMYFDETGISYVNASPNIPTMEAMVLYNGTCYFEGTAISEGRGTTRPFELIGAPWIDPYKIADTMNSYNLAGVRFRPTYFTPTFSKHKDVVCGGVQIHVLDKKEVNAVEVGLRLFDEMRKLSAGTENFWRINPDNNVCALDNLSCCDEMRANNLDVNELLKKWSAQSQHFKSNTEKYRIYK